MSAAIRRKLASGVKTQGVKRKKKTRRFANSAKAVKLAWLAEVFNKATPEKIKLITPIDDKTPPGTKICAF